MDFVLRKPDKSLSWEDVFKGFAKLCYTYEKVMHIRVTGDFPERKLHWFIELIKEDKEFKIE